MTSTEALTDDDESVRVSLSNLLRELGFCSASIALGWVRLGNSLPDMLRMSSLNPQRELDQRTHLIPIALVEAHVDGRRLCGRSSGRRRRISLSRSAILRLARRSTPGLMPANQVLRYSAIVVLEWVFALGTELMLSSVAQLNPIVFVVDDDISVRESLEGLIRFEGWETETFASAEAFLSRPRVVVPSCLVLDVSLPDLTGLELQQRLADRDDIPIIFITGYGNVPMTVQAMKAGAIEFLTKPFDDDTLLSAIRHAIERSRATLDLQDKANLLRHRHASLSRREQQVMALVVTGRPNKRIGFELGISEITVKAHRGQVMRKMQAASLADLVNMAANLPLAFAPERQAR